VPLLGHRQISKVVAVVQVVEVVAEARQLPSGVAQEEEVRSDRQP
jgi:hypothetical protein